MELKSNLNSSTNEENEENGTNLNNFGTGIKSQQSQQPQQPQPTVKKLFNTLTRSLNSLSKSINGTIRGSDALDNFTNNHNSNIIDPFNIADDDDDEDDVKIVDDEGLRSGIGNDGVNVNVNINNIPINMNIINNKKSELIYKLLEINSVNNKSGQSVIVDHMDYGVMERKSMFSGKENIEILKDISFSLKPGMMCLLLGGPGSGVSSLFKCLTNRTPKRGVVNGDILFNNKPIQPDNHHREYLFVQQSDHHIPTLTVRETLDFSIECQSNLPNEKKKQLSDTILQILGISHVSDTFIGNEAIRGISGGQTKRMTVAVELVKGAKAIFMDQSTSGLDSTSAFELLNSVSMISKVANVPALISLLQPSSEIFSLFTHICMLKDGEITFFGERDQVFDHFQQYGLECSNKQNPAEFLASIYQMAELDLDCQLKTSTDFVIAYKQSQYYKDCLINISQERLINHKFSGAQQQQQQLQSSIPAPIQISSQDVNSNYDDPRDYQLPLINQILLNLKRQLLMTTRDRSAILARVLKSSLLGFVMGTLFFSLDDSQKSASLIPSLCFFLLTFVVFGSLAGVGEVYKERPIFYDQKMGKYYKNIAYFFSGLVSDLLWNLMDVIIFCSISYWLIGLNPLVERFFFFVMEIYILDCLVNRVSKMVSVYSPNATIASTLSPLYFSLFLLMAGYLIKKSSIPNYFIWMHYISPFKWVFESILINQVTDQNFKCHPEELLPPIEYPLLNLSYPDGYSGFQICPITTGEQILIQKDISTDPDYKFLSIWIIVGMYSFFSFIQIIGLNYITYDQINSTNNNNSGGNESNKSSPSSLNNSTIIELSNLRQLKLNLIKSDEKCILTFKNLTYKVLVKKKNNNSNKIRRQKVSRTLLDNVNGIIMPGTMVALMGSSGAGKSTLLDILANRKDQGEITGEILLNGKPRDKCFNRYIGYVMQQPVLADYQTVKEAITFSALLRLPNTMNLKEKEDIVDYIINVLELTSIQNTLIGKLGQGITIEQRKRVDIGVEMASMPEILFLDEPTTGLDSISSELIMRLVKKVATDGRSVICTIHQPSESIFSKFDSILLLTQGGFTAYFGSLGNKNYCNVLGYCESLGFHRPKGKSVPDFLLDFSASFDSAKRLALHDKNLPTFRSRVKQAIVPTCSTNGNENVDDGANDGANIIGGRRGDATVISNNNSGCSSNNRRDEDEDEPTSSSSINIVTTKQPIIDIIDNFKFSQLNNEIISSIEYGLPINFKPKEFKEKNATSFLFQFFMLLNRFFVCALRRRNLIFTRMVRSLLLSVVTGALYIQLDKDQDGVMDRVSFIFFTSTFASISCLSNIPSVFEDRFLFYHELDSNAYRHLSYILAMVISDLPFTILYSLLFSVPIYFIAGLQNDITKFFFFIFIYYLYLQVLVSYSQLLAMASPTLATANEITGISFSIFSLFAGFIIKKEDIPSYYKWLNYVSITRYLVEALTINEMTGDKAVFHCDSDQFYQIPIKYTPILQNGTDSGGDNNTKVVYKPLCAITHGDQVLIQFDLKDNYKYDDSFILIGLYVLFLLGILIFSRILKFKK